MFKIRSWQPVVGVSTEQVAVLPELPEVRNNGLQVSDVRATFDCLSFIETSYSRVYGRRGSDDE